MLRGRLRAGGTYKPAGPIKRPEKGVNPRACRDIAEQRPIGWRHMPKWAHERLDRAKMPRQDLANCPRPDPIAPEIAD
jgi:hypothetical protein